MKKFAIALAVVAAATTGVANAADVRHKAAPVPVVAEEPSSPIELGLLKCSVAPAVGYVIVSSRPIDCTYVASSGRVKGHYTGTIGRVGVDLGVSNGAGLVWAVLAPVYNMKPGALEGTYVGASAEATVGVGLGANVLVGGFARSITLNPISVQAQTGLNAAVGVAGLNLTLVR
jgi:hypothetical protein